MRGGRSPPGVASPSISLLDTPLIYMSCVPGVTAHGLLLQEGLPPGVLLGFHTQAGYSSQPVSCLAFFPETLILLKLHFQAHDAA